MNIVMTIRAAIRQRVRDWLGIDADLAMLKHAVDRDTIALDLELRARVDQDRIDIEKLDTFTADLATKHNEMRGIILFHNAVLLRWSTQSETLRAIEARYKRQQERSKVIALPDARIVGGT